MNLEVQQADVTKLEVDAIANAANTRLMHGGGVAGAISRAGGQPSPAGGPERVRAGSGAAVLPSSSRCGTTGSSQRGTAERDGSAGMSG